MSSSIPDPVPDDASPELLRHIINYWRIESLSYQDKWVAAMLASQQRGVMVKQLKDQLAEAKAENERLRKAGDALHCFLIGYIVENRLSSAHLNKLDDDWANAAKGVQS